MLYTRTPVLTSVEKNLGSGPLGPRIPLVHVRMIVYTLYVFVWFSRGITWRCARTTLARRFRWTARRIYDVGVSSVSSVVLSSPPMPSRSVHPGVTCCRVAVSFSPSITVYPTL